MAARGSVVARLLLAALTAAAVVLAGGPAAAHAVLVGTDPERGSTRQGPVEAVVLEFSEPVDFPRVQVVDAEGARVDAGFATVDGERVEQPLRSLETHGEYTVAYRVVSDDGHPIEGDLTFSYVPEPESEPVAPIEPGPLPADPAPAPAEPDPVPDDDAVAGTGLVTGLAVIAFAGAGAGVVLAWRRRAVEPAGDATDAGS